MNMQNPILILKIAYKLKKLRIEKVYNSYESFAMDFDLSRSYYWKVENGNQNISMDYFLSLLNIHQISPKDFFSDIF